MMVHNALFMIYDISNITSKSCRDIRPVCPYTATDRTQDTRNMRGSSNQAPQGPTCLRLEWMMILYLSMEMAIMVREDMNTAMQGNVLTSLKIMNCYE